MLDHTPLTTVLVTLLLSFWAAANIRTRTLKRDPNFLEDRVLRTLLFGWASSIAGLAALSGAAIAAAVLKPMAKPAENLVLSPYVGVIIVSGGAFGFYLKRRHQFLYGLIEATAALGVIGYVSFTPQPVGPKISACVTALYFLVRGLDNLTDSPRLRNLTNRMGLQKR